MNMLSRLLLVAACTVVMSAPAAAKKNAPKRVQESFVVTPDTEHKVSTVVGIGGHRVCLIGLDATTGQPVLTRYRRSLNGSPKELDEHLGEKCFTSKAGTYVVYATALGVTTRVNVVTDEWEVHYTHEFGNPRLNFERF